MKRKRHSPEQIIRKLRRADAEAGQIERLLVYKYDRLGRNLAETGNAGRPRQAHGIAAGLVGLDACGGGR